MILPNAKEFPGFVLVTLDNQLLTVFVLIIIKEEEEREAKDRNETKINHSWKTALSEFKNIGYIQGLKNKQTILIIRAD